MKKLISILLFITVLISCAFSIFADEETETIPEETEGVFELAQVQASEAEENGAEYDGFILKIDPAEEIETDKLNGIELLDAEEGLYAVESLETIKGEFPQEIVEYIEPDYVLELFDAEDPNDHYISDQWNVDELNVRPVWGAGIEGQDLDDAYDIDHDGNYVNDQMIIAVLDSGLNVYHEDIDISRIIDPYNIIDGSSDVSDTVGHGTFVTGIIMANKDNVIGIAGLGQSIRVMPVKVFEDNNTPTSQVVSAIKYIVAQKRSFIESDGSTGINVSVINISFGGSNPSETLKTAVLSAIDEGIIVICAAGNSGNAEPIYPAMYALGVGSYNRSGRVSSFSQRLSPGNGEGFRNKVWICAPGEGVYSTYRDDSSYEKKSGTSYSCPEVAALAAICKGLDNSLDHYSFKSLLKDNAIISDSGLGNVDGQDYGFGWGKIDFQAVASAASVANYPREDGWYESQDGFKYYFINHKGVKGWRLIDEKWYFFNKKGQMQTGWIKPYSAWYYLDSSGEMQTGWADIDGKRYYFSESGAMATNWANIDNKWYYFGGSGAMQTGWIKPYSVWYYLNSSGEMQTGWADIDGKRYYFSESGAMATKWAKIDHKWYYFGESGAMQTGWVCDIDGTWYYLKEAGYIAVNEWVPGYWWLGANGAWTHKYRGSWHKNSRGWWFGDTTGWYAKNTTIIIDNVRYTFDANGYLK